MTFPITCLVPLGSDESPKILRNILTIQRAKVQPLTESMCFWPSQRKGLDIRNLKAFMQSTDEEEVPPAVHQGVQAGLKTNNQSTERASRVQVDATTVYIGKSNNACRPTMWV